jgi:dolichol-phosphate mannosyltransferase
MFCLSRGASLFCQEYIMTPFPPANPIQLSIVIPAYNEADNIPLVIQDTVATLESSALAGRYELLLVNDGSSDDSQRVADDLARQYACLRVFQHAQNMGMGEALKTGFKNSRGAHVTFIAGDGEIKADQALRLYQQMGDADMMTSTRLGYVEGKSIRTRSVYRGVLSWGFRTCARMILGCNPEKLTGIYVIRGGIVRSLPLHARTSLVSLEIYLHCVYSGANMKHGEIIICRRLSGTSKIANVSGIWHQLWEMIKLRRQIREHIQQNPSPVSTMSRAA